MTGFKFSFCFSKDGKIVDDAHAQANRTENAVMFFEGEKRYVLFPNDDHAYSYNTKEDVFALEERKMRNDFIKHYGVTPEVYFLENLAS